MGKQATAEPTPIAAPAGYLPAARPRWRWVECAWTAGEDDGEIFRAEIRSNLTWGDIDAIDLSGALSYADLWELMAPHVRDWNALGRDAETGEPAPVPPPAVGGADSFRALEPAITLWLATQLRTVHLGGEERGKGRQRQDASPGQESDAA